MVRLTVHTEAALLHSSQLLQLLVQDVHCLLHTLPLRHRHLANTASQTKRRIMLENISVIDNICYRKLLRHITWSMNDMSATERCKATKAYNGDYINTRVCLNSGNYLPKLVKMLNISNNNNIIISPSDPHWCFASSFRRLNSSG